MLTKPAVVTRITLFDDGDAHAAYASALAGRLSARGASVRRVTLVPPDAKGGRAFDGDVEVLACPALSTGVRGLRAAADRLPARVGRLAAAAAGRVPTVMLWRSLLALSPGFCAVVGAGTPLALGLAREQPTALVIDPDTSAVDASVELVLARAK